MNWPRRILRSGLLRLILPLAIAVSLIAAFGVPYLDRLLGSWFRSDVQLRAQLVASSIQQPLVDLLEAEDLARLRTYLADVTSDERLLGVMICRENDTALAQTRSWPQLVGCKGSRDTDIDISQFPLPTPTHGELKLVVAHDLTFINRRQSAARNYLVAFVVVALSTMALIAGAGLRMLLNRWVRLLIGDIRALRFLDDAESPALSMPVLSRVRQALREAEANQRLEIDFHENWTPQALQQVARDHLGGQPIIVVSNREPYIHNRRDSGDIEVQLPASGMVTAIEPIMRACSGTWIAHGSGSGDRLVVDRYDHIAVPPDAPQYTLRRVWLTAEEEQGYYYGFCNEGLWPLCHLAYVRPAFREGDWQSYRAVNATFAAAVAAEAPQHNPIILIQDFHFALLPRLIRRLKPAATIALFWHVPWPNAETFGVCPWKQEILHDLLAADILGFHTRYHCQNFLATVDRFVECQIDHEHMTITHHGHVCRVAPYPISIEWPPRWTTGLPGASTAARTVRSRYGIATDTHLLLGVERWDFTKGISERLLALESLLDSAPRWRGHVTLLQVAAPSRSSLAAYQALQQHTRAETDRINQRFGTDTWKPVVLVDHHLEPPAVFELYRACDVCIVNSLHDGMNLVAKEFVAARDDLDGMLILSSFAGASRELLEAVLVNPFDVVETAEAIETALTMSRTERRERMRLMRRTVKEFNVYRWAGRMLLDVAHIRQRHVLTNRVRERRA